MGLLEEMGISAVGELSLDELKGKLFEARKKAVLRQNAANTDKRVKAELLMEAIGEISTMLDSIADDSVDYALLVNTFAHAHDCGQINKDLKEALVKAAQKDIPNIERLTEFYRKNGPQELSSGWTNYCCKLGGKIIIHVKKPAPVQQAAPTPQPVVETTVSNKMPAKLTAIIGYLTIFGFLFAVRYGDWKGARVHLNNSLLIIIARWLLLFVCSKVFGSSGGVLQLIIAILWLRGFIWAVQDQEKELPFIGKIKLLPEITIQ